MSSSSNEVTATGITTNHANDPAPTEVAIAPRRSSRRLSIVKRVVMKEVDEFDDDDDVEEEQEDDTNNDESQEANPMKKSARKKKVTAPRKREKPVVRKKSAPRMKPVVRKKSAPRMKKPVARKKPAADDHISSSATSFKKKMKEHRIPGDPDKGKARFIEMINQMEELKKYRAYFDIFKDRGSTLLEMESTVLMVSILRKQLDLS